MKEKEDARAELYETVNQFEDVKKKFNTLKNEHHTVTGDLERLRTEHFVAAQRLLTIEKEHEQEVLSYKEEIEELSHKVKDLERKLEEAKEEVDHMSNSDEFKLDEDLVTGDLGLSEVPLEGDDYRRPSTARYSVINREKRVSFNSNSSSGFKNTLVQDSLNKGLLEKEAELLHQIEELKLTNQKLKAEIDQFSAKLKEEGRQLELAKKKIEAKDHELESYRKKTLEDTDKFTMVVNEVNEELEARDEKIKILRKQIRAMQSQVGTVPPVRPAK